MFRGLLGTGSELTWFPRDPELPCGPPVTVEDWGSHVINRVLAQVHLKMGAVSPCIHPVVISQFQNA